MSLRSSGSILLISCYELGHQPLGAALPQAFLERAGFAPDTLDIAVERFDPGKIARARFVGISVPMHTALRLGVRVAERVREINPAAKICLYGLYAALNADYLLEHGADFCIGGECEGPLVSLAEALESGHLNGIAGVIQRGQAARPFLQRLPFAVPSRMSLPTLDKYARLEHNGDRRVVGYVEASRGCLHLCTHCPRARIRFSSALSANGTWWLRNSRPSQAGRRPRCRLGSRHRFVTDSIVVLDDGEPAAGGFAA